MDEIVDAASLNSVALEAAERFKKLDKDAHYQSKLRARESMLKNMKSGISKDRQELLVSGAKAMVKKSLQKFR